MSGKLEFLEQLSGILEPNSTSARIAEFEGVLARADCVTLTLHRVRLLNWKCHTKKGGGSSPPFSYSEVGPWWANLLVIVLLLFFCSLHLVVSLAVLGFRSRR
jgi:hypothetical protein